MAKIPQVKESAEYENFVGKKQELQDPTTSLLDFLGEDGVAEPEDDDETWRKHWKDMPEFVQHDNKTYKSIQVHFRCKEDYDEFAKLISQNLTDKTKSIWHPKLDITKNSLMRWIEEE